MNGSIFIEVTSMPQHFNLKNEMCLSEKTGYKLLFSFSYIFLLYGTGADLFRPLDWWNQAQNCFQLFHTIALY
jgi:hypothetical protein